MNQPTHLDLDALQARIDSAANYGFDHVVLESDILAALIDRLRKAEALPQWIGVTERLPNNGQRIHGMSPRGTWTETFDKDEPIGLMTHWLAAAPDSTPTDSADSEGAKG